MGESVEEALNNEDKMGNGAPRNPVIEVSVSFGRFESDSLSWEKFSSFSPNKYLEEVGKCATPGSVAQKKAYFEEHYKKIAAKKSELLGEEKPMESKLFKSDDQDHGDMNGEANGQSSVEEVKDECNLTTEANGICNDGVPNQEAATTITTIKTAIECLSSSAEGEMKEKNCELESVKLCELETTVQEEVVSLKEEEICCNGAQDKKELPQNSEKEKSIRETPKIKEKSLKLDHRSKSHKINTPIKKEKKVAEAKMKPASPGNKTPQFYTPRISKPKSTTGAAPSSQTSLKGGTVSSLTRPKNPSVRESNKVALKSLHLSLSVDASGSNPAPPSTTRKSLIMERMGDKDIVKRAFKTFQSNYNELRSSSSSVERSATPKQQSAKGTEPEVSTSLTPRKENGGSVRAGGMEKKNAKAAPSNVGLRSDGKELSKKLEEKSSARETERTRLQIKSKDDREAEVKRLGKSRNFKAMPMPSFYHGQKQSKSHLDKNTMNHSHQ